jgi:hypothetical protein
MTCAVPPGGGVWPTRIRIRSCDRRTNLVWHIGQTDRTAPGVNSARVPVGNVCGMTASQPASGLARAGRLCRSPVPGWCARLVCARVVCRVAWGGGGLGRRLGLVWVAAG